MSHNIQNLIDVWEQRPRRQLDYSGLTEDSLHDLEWTNSVLKALIPSMSEIREKFDLHPTPAIVIQMPPIQAPNNEGEALTTQWGDETPPTPQIESQEENTQNEPALEAMGVPTVPDALRTPAIQPAHAEAACSDSPSKKARKVRAKASSTGTRSKKSRPARTVEAPDQKQGSDSTSESAAAKPSPEPDPTKPSEPSSPTSEQVDLSDPPAPSIVSVE